jgi:putative spermidine/putrescine transport system ATP-binding protein
MFQSYALWPHMSVAANIGYGLRMRGAARAAIARRVEELLALMQLQGFAARSVTQLSGGQRQRVALARALAVDPKLLLLDEPMSNLDYKVRIELRHELRALQKRIGITAVYVTHDREEALTLADRIAVLDAGHVVQYGSPEEIFHRPVSAFVAGFMGADNAIELTRGSDGRLRAGRASADAGERVTGHFRSDVAWIDASGRGEADADLRLPGRVVQTLYVGQGYRYRVSTDGADVWAHASHRIDEGAPVAVVVPRNALLLFPRAGSATPS